MPDFAKLIDKARARIIARFPGLNLSTAKNRKALAAVFLALAVGIGIVFVRVSSAASQRAEMVDAFDENVTISVPDAEDLDILDAEDAIDAFETADGVKGNFSGRMARDMFDALVPELPASLTQTPQQAPEGNFRDEAMRSLGDTTSKALSSRSVSADAAFRKQQETLLNTKAKLERVRDSLSRESKRQEQEHRARLNALGYDPDTGQPISDERRAELSRNTASTAPATQDSNDEKKEEEFVSATSVRRSGSVSSLDDGGGWNSVGGVSSLDGESDLVNTSNHPFEVMFTKNEKISSGGRVSIRILEDMMIEGVRIPENTQMSAICSIGSNRLEVKVQALKVNDKIYTLNLTGYDTDGLEGLYCPQTELNRGTQQAKSEAGQLIRSALQSGIAGYAGQVVSSGASIIQSVSGNVTISVNAGYKFYLIKKEN